MAAWDFADIYTRSPRACGPRALGVYISKIPRSHGITITCISICNYILEGSISYQHVFGTNTGVLWNLAMISRTQY